MDHGTIHVENLEIGEERPKRSSPDVSLAYTTFSNPIESHSTYISAYVLLVVR